MSKIRPNSEYLVWMDLEMSGLDRDQDVILEIATIVTNSDLEILATGPNITIKHEEDILSQMDDWCIKTHTESGLVEKVCNSNTTTKEAEKLTLEFLKQWVEPKSSPLCGNSIRMDREFIEKQMPLLDDYLHYRCIDVSTIKELAHRWKPEIKKFEKTNNHKAICDIKNSINELKYYVANNFINK